MATDDVFDIDAIVTDKDLDEFLLDRMGDQAKLNIGAIFALVSNGYKFLGEYDLDRHADDILEDGGADWEDFIAKNDSIPIRLLREARKQPNIRIGRHYFRDADLGQKVKDFADSTDGHGDGAYALSPGAEKLAKAIYDYWQIISESVVDDLTREAYDKLKLDRFKVSLD